MISLSSHNDFLEKKLFELTEKAYKLRGAFDVDGAKITFHYKVYLISVPDDFECFVPTGSKTKPAGIMDKEVNCVLFVKKCVPLYLLRKSHIVPALKDILDAGKAKFEMGTLPSGDKVRGFIVNLKDLHGKIGTMFDNK